MNTLTQLPQPVRDGLFVFSLLVVSALVVVGALWIAQVLEQRQSAGRRANDGGIRFRVTMGALATAVSVTMMLGIFPGIPFNMYSAMACFGCALLGMGTSISAYRDGQSTLGVSLPKLKTTHYRRAA